jgi:DMSO/TMAO reductase YedYZ heme-binding membrane subunit
VLSIRKYWKRLHRLIYLASLAGTSQAILAAGASKKMFVRDPQAIPELAVYLVVLVVLLVVRLPPVRRGLKQMLALLRPRRLANPLVVTITTFDRPPIYRSKVDDGEVNILGSC